MSSFKQHLELAQSFQIEMADVDWVSVTVSVYSFLPSEGDPGDKFVSIIVSGVKIGHEDHFFQLIHDKITAESLAEIKEELKGFGYEI